MHPCNSSNRKRSEGALVGNGCGQLQLSLSLGVQEYKVATCRALLSLRDSTDDLVKQAGVTTMSGCKWAASATVEQAVNSLKLQDIIYFHHHFLGRCKCKVQVTSGQSCGNFLLPLEVWGLREDPFCKLCRQKGTLAHKLSGCKTALTQGWYRWRHDKVLL